MAANNEIKLLCETFLIWQIFDKIQWKIVSDCVHCDGYSALSFSATHMHLQIINISLYNTVIIIYLLFYMGVEFSLSQTGKNLHWAVSEQDTENSRI